VRGKNGNQRESQQDELTRRARELRLRQTKAESLLWGVLRSRRLCGLKFRRQHPLDPFVADFACIEMRLIVEIDGGYHDYVYANDLTRQQKLEAQGWRVIRFSNEDVLADVEAVAIAIAVNWACLRSFEGDGRSNSRPTRSRHW
jgi:very-short-patch-repair endonuclease